MHLLSMEIQILSSLMLQKDLKYQSSTEAGNRCFDENVPEEINRKIIDHISDINFVISKNARNYLIREGIKQNLIIKTDLI